MEHKSRVINTHTVMLPTLLDHCFVNNNYIEHNVRSAGVIASTDRAKMTESNQTVGRKRTGFKSDFELAL